MRVLAQDLGNQMPLPSAYVDDQPFLPEVIGFQVIPGPSMGLSHEQVEDHVRPIVL